MSNIIGIKFHSGYTANPVDKNHYTLKDNVTGIHVYKMNYRQHEYLSWEGLVLDYRINKARDVIKFIYSTPFNKSDWL